MKKAEFGTPGPGKEAHVANMELIGKIIAAVGIDVLKEEGDIDGVDLIACLVTATYFIGASSLEPEVRSDPKHSAEVLHECITELVDVVKEAMQNPAFVEGISAATVIGSIDIGKTDILDDLIGRMVEESEVKH